MWNKITNFLSFTGVTDKTVWQDVLFSSFLIPIIIFLGVRFLKWWDKIRPSRLIFKDYLTKDSRVFIFHSEMSSADDNWNLKSDPKYITRFPQPIPTNHANLEVQKKINIDPVSSGADSECVADVFNILGLVSKTKNIYIGNLINDWNVWSDPIFSIGFNPKTHKLIERCYPIFFELVDSTLKIKDTTVSFNSLLPNDAGVIQKTFDEESRNPVFILAGLGTTGTSAAGYILKNNFVKLGKLFGNDPFCVFFKVKIDEGKNSASIQKIIPNPKWIHIILHPILYFDFKNKGYFEIENEK